MLLGEEERHEAPTAAHPALMPSLEVLLLRGNDIEELPPSMEKLSSLAVLDLGFNELHTLSPLLPLMVPNLKQLDVSCNKIEELPGMGALRLDSECHRVRESF